MFGSRFGKAVLHGVACLIVFLVPAALQAGSVDEVVDFVAQEIQKYLAEKQQNELSLTTFSGPADTNVQLVENKIREKLKSLNVEINDLTDWNLKGEISIDRSGAIPEIALLVSLLDKDGQPQQEFLKRFKESADEKNLGVTVKESTTSGTSGNPNAVPNDASSKKAEGVEIRLDKAEEAPKLLGVNADIQQSVEKVLQKPANTLVRKSTEGLSAAERQQRQEDEKTVQEAIEGAIRSASQSKSFFTSAALPSLLRANQESRFGLEVMKSSDPRQPSVPVPVQNKAGKAFVDLQEGDFVEIAIQNDNDFEVALELLVDGVNTLQEAEQESFRTTGRWVLPPASRVRINGWFKNPETVSRFKITSEPEGVAEKYGLKQKIGTIQANFFMCFQQPVKPSPGISDVAPLFTVLGSPAAKDGAFGEGPPDQFNGTIVQRAFDKGFPLATLTILHKNPDPPGLPVPGVP